MILLALFLFALIMFIPTIQEKKRDEFVEEVKACPPHKWQYREVKDQHGNILRYKIVCDVCGPLKNE
jgi:hypothetical protein